MSKLLMLGGTNNQLPLIQSAKAQGHYVILCDYTTTNPGIALVDKHYQISTLDRAAVLDVAQKEDVKGVISNSEPAMVNVAYVANQLGLPGNPEQSVNILTHKDLFRAFLREHNFNVPEACGYDSYAQAAVDLARFRFPIMVKPVDAAGSKGVVKVNDVSGVRAAVEEALSYSREKRFIIEEFITKKGYQISGDGFSIDGKLVFTSYGNELYSGKGTREYVALGEFWPSLLTAEQKQMVDDELQHLITALGMRTCAYNIEVILDQHEKPYIIEFAPRNGGSYIPRLIRYATGVDLYDYTIRGALGEDCSDLVMTPTKGCWSNYMILSKQSGIFDGLWFDENFKRNNLLEVHCTAQPGDVVHAYQNTTHSLGTILFKADTVDEMIEITSNIENYHRVEVKHDIAVL